MTSAHVSSWVFLRQERHISRDEVSPAPSLHKFFSAKITPHLPNKEPSRGVDNGSRLLTVGKVCPSKMT